MKAAIVGAGVVVGRDRDGRPGATRSRARPDEDAITLAAEAAAHALPPALTRVGAIIFASTTAPYRDGGSVQPLAELLGLHGDVIGLELTASNRDGLTALRLATALAAADAPVLVCAANYRSQDPSAGDGAAALVVAAPAAATEPLAVITPVASSARELRDQWRLADDTNWRTADPSFVESVARELTEHLLARVPASLTAPTVAVTPSLRASRRLERELGGPGDTVTSQLGVLGAAHPLVRMLSGLAAAQLVTAVAAGLGEAVHVQPTEAGGRWSLGLAAGLADAPVSVRAAARNNDSSGFSPYASGPRSWRERDRDLRLVGIVDPAGNDNLVPARRPPTGVVVSWTRDHVYPVAEPVEMAAVALDAGGQFFGQVAEGEHVAIGGRVELVPRRLHSGNGQVQYFWKARPCR